MSQDSDLTWKPGSLRALRRSRRSGTAGELDPARAVASPVEVASVASSSNRGEACAVAAAGDDADLASNPIRLSKRRITELAACERHLVATFGRRRQRRDGDRRYTSGC